VSKDRRLGRGLAALLGDPLPESAHAAAEPTPTIHKVDSDECASTDGRADSPGEGLLMLAVDEIEENPFQPRRDFGETEIASLAESLKTHDMLQPILVRRVDDRWQLISGERRLRAAIRAGWTQIPARARDADDRLVAELAIVENLQRKDLNALEKALSFQRYLQQHGCTQEELGQRLKIDRSTIANLLRLLELPPQVQAAIRDGTITAGHAKALLPLGDQREQISFCRRISDEGLSVRATERIVADFTAEHDGTLPLAGRKKSSREKQTGQVAMIEQELRRAMGTKVDLQTGARGRGKIVVHFKNAEEFERLYAYLMDDSISIRAAGT
jgi:ParB family chromosome partitioning protein